MLLLSRLILPCILLLTLVSSSVAPNPNPEPELQPHEALVYNIWKYAFPAFYQPINLDAEPVSYLMHLIVAHPNLEQQALQHALRPGHGPYLVEEAHGALYATTLVPGDRGPGRVWNLQQHGPNAHRLDAALFWRIDGNGPKMLRFDVWPAGAQVQEAMSMRDAISRFRAP